MSILCARRRGLFSQILPLWLTPWDFRFVRHKYRLQCFTSASDIMMFFGGTFLGIRLFCNTVFFFYSADFLVILVFLRAIKPTFQGCAVLERIDAV